jgi:hypothetical protein
VRAVGVRRRSLWSIVRRARALWWGAGVDEQGRARAGGVVKAAYPTGLYPGPCRAEEHMVLISLRVDAIDHVSARRTAPAPGATSR